jgi:hypothetical protein
VTPHLLYLILVLGIQTAPQADWDRERPCGVWTAVCDAALTHHGLDPHAYAPPTGYRDRWRDVFGWTQWCESKHDPLAVGDFDRFGRAHSKGLWQFSDTYQPQVSNTQAFDPYWSTYEAARQWAGGFAVRWSCYRIHTG